MAGGADNAGDGVFNIKTIGQALDSVNDAIQAVPFGHSYAYISTGTTTTVKSGAGVLRLIAINKAVATATITIYDNTAGSGTVIGVITFGAALLSDPEQSKEFDLAFGTGLTIVTSGATDLTVVYR